MLTLAQAEHWAVLLHDGETTAATVTRDAGQFVVKLQDVENSAETLLADVTAIITHLFSLVPPAPTPMPVEAPKGDDTKAPLLSSPTTDNAMPLFPVENPVDSTDSTAG